MNDYFERNRTIVKSKKSVNALLFRTLHLAGSVMAAAGPGPTCAAAWVSSTTAAALA